MKNRYNDDEAKKFIQDPLKMRVYTSRLLGQESNLVLHGGGNTSVKAKVQNIFGDWDDVLWIKGSGWDLATIEAGGFAPVKMDVLLRMAELSVLSDSAMVKGQRTAMLDPTAPNPSVEAILHAIIPFQYVDHTHADAVVTITNTPDGFKRIQDVFGDRLLYIPYVMPGFVLARKVYEMTRQLDWSTIDGILLMNHGLFTFHDEAKKSYAMMIKLVSKAEKYLQSIKRPKVTVRQGKDIDPLVLARLRKEVSLLKGSAMIARCLRQPRHVAFAGLKNIRSIASRGPLTPDHIIRTKQSALVIESNPSKDLVQYQGEYEAYFKRYAKPHHQPLDPAPRWAVYPGVGLLSFGSSVKDVMITADIIDHTIEAIQNAELMGGWRALPQQDLFEMEYWELEQAKLKTNQRSGEFQGKVAVVTGAASGIGRACVQAYLSAGAAVVALDIDESITTIFQHPAVCPIICDLTHYGQMVKAIEHAVMTFGGIDILVSNAGLFPVSQMIDHVSEEIWQKSLEINLTAHQRLLKVCAPYLAQGINPSVVIVASKNVPAPGPGASAYSVAKAGLTQLARVAALEWGALGIRVNVVHPNQVFDTAIWTPEVLEKRAKAYGLSVEEYKTHNLLKTEIKSSDVAQLVMTLSAGVFSKTTGAQIPIDGGNDRVI